MNIKLETAIFHQQQLIEQLQHRLNSLQNWVNTIRRRLDEGWTHYTLDEIADAERDIEDLKDYLSRAEKALQLMKEALHDELT